MNWLLLEPSDVPAGSPVVLRGQIVGNTMTLVIDIDFRSQMDQVIHVTFGCAPTSTETFTDKLVVSVNGESCDPQDATVEVGHLANGNINFTLNDFTLDGVGGVGNISLDNLVLDGEGKFSYTGVARIGKGSDSNVQWLGPSLGDIPLEMKGQIYTYDGTKFLIAVIDIDMQESIQQTIHVTFGIHPVSTKVYTDDLVVSVNGTAAPAQDATVTVGTLGNGHINFTLNDFVLAGDMYVGNIAVENLEVDAAGKFSFVGSTRVSAGSDASKDWLGPSLGDVPLDMKGQFYTYEGEDGELYYVADDTGDGIEVRTVVIHQAATRMYCFCNFGNVLFKDTQGVGVGHHHGCHLIVEFRAQVVHVDGPVR